MTKIKGARILARLPMVFAGFLGAALISHARAARSEEWPILGSRALGMGGAGVAVTRGGAAVYWNPAALARGGRVPAARAADVPADAPAIDAAEERVRWSGGFGMSAMFAFPGDTLRELDVLHDDLKLLNVENFENKLSSGTPPTELEIQTALRIIGTDIPALDQPGEGVLVEVIGGPSFQVGRFGFAALASVFGGVTAQVDFTNLAFGDDGIDFIVGPGQDRSSQLSSAGQTLADQLTAGGGITQDQAEEIVFQAESAGVNTADPQVRTIVTNVVQDTIANEGGSIDNFITNNQSGATERGILLQELVVGYGLPIGDWLALGITVKAMHAFTSMQTFVIKDIPNSKDMIEKALDFENVEGSFNFGTDAGALITPVPWLALGVTGRNLNRPAFELHDGGHMVLDPNARAGMAIFPTPWLTLAADMDLFHNHSEVLPGHRSQVLATGAQVDLRFIALRAGLSKNLLDEEEEVLIHGGVAVRIGFFSLEAAAALTPELQGIEANTVEVPERAGASLTLGFNMDF